MSVGDQVSMFYNAKPLIFEKAKQLRDNMTVSELKLWKELKGKQILGLRFRAQHPIDIFVVDFYCHSLKLVIEVDGGIHDSKDQKEYDIGREAELTNWGIVIIRFTNDEIDNDINKVLNKISLISNKIQQIPRSPLQGIQGCLCDVNSLILYRKSIRLIATNEPTKNKILPK